MAPDHTINSIGHGEPYEGVLLLSTINSLSPRIFELNLRKVSVKVISVIGGRVISCEIALR